MTHGNGAVAKANVARSSNFFKKTRNADFFQLFKHQQPIQKFQPVAEAAKPIWDSLGAFPSPSISWGQSVSDLCPERSSFMNKVL